MNKISLIIQREYLTRVKKKSFIIMTILGPLLFGGFFAAMTWMMTKQDDQVRKIVVVDETGLFADKLKESNTLKFDYVDTDVNTLKETFFDMNNYGILFIPKIVVQSPNAVQFYSDKQPSINIKEQISNSMEKIMEDEKLKAYEIDNLDKIMKSVKTNVTLQTIRLESGGEEKSSNTEIAMGLAYIAGLLIYMFIFIYGAQVMRGVIEEKTSRIVEVIISSVKPFQLMLGKVIGIALVGLTQFILWVVLSFGVIQIVQDKLSPEMPQQTITQTTPQSIMGGDQSIAQNEIQQPLPANQDLTKMQSIFKMIKTINWVEIVLTFLFFFLFGYLLYGSLFAAIGSAVDNETDTQQFMFPITIPLILGLLVMFNALNNPESPIVFWFSIIPLTSPIVMMARIPFEVPAWELLLSMVVLILTFLGTTWLAGKIYRTGILMYGKKVNYKEILKWLRYKN